MDYPKRGVSYFVRPSYALGWRQVHRTCTDLILRMAEIINILFTKPLQVRYYFNLFFYPKRWEIRICVSKENFPEGAGALHLPRSSGVRWARPAGQKSLPGKAKPPAALAPPELVPEAVEPPPG